MGLLGVLGSFHPFSPFSILLTNKLPGSCSKFPSCRNTSVGKYWAGWCLLSRYWQGRAECGMMEIACQLLFTGTDVWPPATPHRNILPSPSHGYRVHTRLPYFLSWHPTTVHVWTIQIQPVNTLSTMFKTFRNIKLKIVVLLFSFSINLLHIYIYLLTSQKSIPLTILFNVSLFLVYLNQ